MLIIIKIDLHESKLFTRYSTGAVHSAVLSRNILDYNLRMINIRVLVRKHVYSKVL